MNKDKQLENERYDIARIMAENFHINGEGWDESTFEWTAHCVQMEGYRKQSQPYSRGHEKGGEWIAHRDPFDICATDFVCSACRESFCSSELTDDEFFEMMKYCPNCGVKMGGGAE